MCADNPSSQAVRASATAHSSILAKLVLRSQGREQNEQEDTSMGACTVLLPRRPCVGANGHPCGQRGREAGTRAVPEPSVSAVCQF